MVNLESDWGYMRNTWCVMDCVTIEIHVRRVVDDTL